MGAFTDCKESNVNAEYGPDCGCFHGSSPCVEAYGARPGGLDTPTNRLNPLWYTSPRKHHNSRFANHPTYSPTPGPTAPTSLPTIAPTSAPTNATAVPTTAAPTYTPIIANPSFELGTLTTAPLYYVNTEVTSWTVSGDVTYLPSPSPTPWDPTPLLSAEGARFIGLKGSGASISQSISNHFIGVAHTVNFDAATRSGQAATGLHVKLDGSIILSVSSTTLSGHTGSFQPAPYAATYTPTVSTHTLSFENDGAGDTVFVDDLDLQYTHPGR